MHNMTLTLPLVTKAYLATIFDYEDSLPEI